MIVSRSPLRISLGGGGTDLPSYYREYGSTFISASIDKYVYLAIHKNFAKEFVLKYSELERAKTIAELRHPLVREALKLVGQQDEDHLEIVSFADIPAGTGLGSSGAFTVALLKGLYLYAKRVHSVASVAEDACHIEMDLLKEPVGKQDQYASAFGGLRRFDIDTAGKVTVSPVPMPPSARLEFEERLMLFYTRQQRSASAVLRHQDEQSRKNGSSTESSDMLQNLHETQKIGLQSYDALVAGNLHAFADLMNAQWEQKRRRSPGTTNDGVAHFREQALKNGALGAKLIGAGGGGFLMFLAEDKHAIRKAMAAEGLPEVPFRIDELGAHVVTHQ